MLSIWWAVWQKTGKKRTVQRLQLLIAAVEQLAEEGGLLRHERVDGAPQCLFLRQLVSF